MTAPTVLCEPVREVAPTLEIYKVIVNDLSGSTDSSSTRVAVNRALHTEGPVLGVYAVSSVVGVYAVSSERTDLCFAGGGVVRVA